MRVSRARAFLLLLALAAPAGAQTVVTSAGPERVAVTVYRDPGRDAGEPFDLEWLDGFALISETRRIAIPAGEAQIRFEGVAGGMLPQSAIVGGLPDGIVERNRDARLLSPGSLLDGSLGRRVHLRRTSPATGAVTEEQAVIRSGADGAVVLQTARGFEALRCTGLPETLVYDGLPDGLSARPTLSVRTRARAPLTATVTLSYLASGFDWQANYIATLSPDGTRVSLFAWLTLANGDETGFADAETQAVAGRLNREPVDADPPETPQLVLACWPQGTTNGVPIAGVAAEESADGDPNIGDTLNDLPALRSEFAQIVVTAQRAVQEELGDLKLYRIPEPVSVAARSQKQVAFLERPGVQVRMVHRHRFDGPDREDDGRPDRVLVTRNRAAEGLGIPLPAGGVALFTVMEGRPVLVGEGSIADRAVGEDVEIIVGEAEGVAYRIEEIASGRGWRDYLVTVSNDHAAPVGFEGEFAVNDGLAFRPRGRLGRRDGRPLWAVTVPANGTATLRYRLVERGRG